MATLRKHIKAHAHTISCFVITIAEMSIESRTNCVVLLLLLIGYCNGEGNQFFVWRVVPCDRCPGEAECSHVCAGYMFSLRLLTTEWKARSSVVTPRCDIPLQLISKINIFRERDMPVRGLLSYKI